ncbi:MAG: CHAP domain-containing protein [Thermonemataceae bacterium]
MKRKAIVGSLGLVALVIIYFLAFKNTSTTYQLGQKVDSLNGVYVYYNGSTNRVSGRHLTDDSYNLGLKYQCVEFVKRYYYEYLDHKMPDSYGHAKDFFNPSLTDGQLNKQRNLIQYSNPSTSKSKVNDLLIFAPTAFNKYGHVAIVAKVSHREVEIIQQNAGKFASTRASYDLVKNGSQWYINQRRIVGWLRKE